MAKVWESCARVKAAEDYKMFYLSGNSHGTFRKQFRMLFPYQP